MNPVRTINKVIAPLKRRLTGMIARALIQRITQENGLILAQVQPGSETELESDVECFYPFGFVSIPPEKTDAVLLRIGAQFGHTILLATNDRKYRPELKSGESALYSKKGELIHLTEDRKIKATADKSLSVNIGEADTAQFTIDDEKTSFEYEGTQSEIDSSGIKTTGTILGAGGVSTVSGMPGVEGQLITNNLLVLEDAIITGTLTVNEDIIIAGQSLKQFIQTHTHSGVQSGSGSSGPPE